MRPVRTACSFVSQRGAALEGQGADDGGHHQARADAEAHHPLPVLVVDLQAAQAPPQELLLRHRHLDHPLAGERAPSWRLERGCAPRMASLS